MHPLATAGVSTKGNRQSVKAHRRFPDKSMRKKVIIPLSAPMPRKAKNARRGLRILGFIALFFISLSTISVWRKRSLIRRRVHRVLSVSSHASKTPVTANKYPVQHEALKQSTSQGTQRAQSSKQDPTQSTSTADKSKDFESPIYDVPNSTSGLAGRPPTLAEEKNELFNAGNPGNNLAVENDDDNDNDSASDTDKKATDTKPSESVKNEEMHMVSSATSNDSPAIASSSSQSSQQSTSDSSKTATSAQSDSPKTATSAQSDSSKTATPAQSEPQAAPLGQLSTSEEAPVTYEEFPERIEWYSRDDFKDGTRPLCRITHPYILSNGSILLPAWMQRYERLLDRCAIGKHGFYSLTDHPTYMQKSNILDVDFALTIHLSRFQEPTHDTSVYLTEHVLKASYLFDIFGGDAKETEAIHEEHCFTYSNDSNCDLKRPPRTGLKPGIFVPRRIETGSRETWAYKIIEMFGRAHGHGNGVVHLNASSILVSKHAGKKDNLIGTRFRSILTMDGMFRHLPNDAVKFGNFFSMKNNIDRLPKQFLDNGRCRLKIGIANTDQDEGFKGASDLRSKLDVLTKFALPDGFISAVSVDVKTKSVDNIARQMKNVDIYVAASGNDMDNIGFLRASSTVFEMMPFGIRPNTYESLARSLGLGYESMRGNPQTEFFKKCLDGELFTLRKKGRVSFTEKPAWFEPVIKAWDDGVAELTKTAASGLDMLSADAPIRNYHSRVCAERQAVHVNIDEAARHIVLMAKTKCTAK